MPAGDLVTVDWTVELRATLMGATTIYRLAMGGAAIGGLGVPGVKATDLDLTDQAGAYGGRDRNGVRVVTVPLVIRTASASSAMVGVSAMNATWAPSTSDIPLYFRLPGFNKFYVNGRPRGLDVDLKDMQFGIVRCLGTFVALTPTITYV
ncbi:MAG: hypothetical protein ABIS21_04995 [Acidimicrobiales bacterium]